MSWLIIEKHLLTNSIINNLLGGYCFFTNENLQVLNRENTENQGTLIGQLLNS
jgi:hypothetical protein